jgi:hypothetical protein
MGNSVKMDLRKTWQICLHCICLAQGIKQGRNILNQAINIWVPRKFWKFLSGWVAGDFSHFLAVTQSVTFELINLQSRKSVLILFKNQFPWQINPIAPPLEGLIEINDVCRNPRCYFRGSCNTTEQRQCSKCISILVYVTHCALY